MDEQETRKAVHDRIDQLDVPQDLVAAAIETGIDQASGKQVKPRRRRHLGRWILTAAAAVLLGVGGLAAVNPSVSRALSNVAWLTNFYLHHDDHFNSFHVNGIAKSMDQKVTSNGVTVHLVEAYYNGRTIGYTGEVTGLTKAIDPEQDWVPLDLDDTPAKNLTSSTSNFEPTKSGFRFHATFLVDKGEVPESVLLPIRISNVNGVVGRWNFNINLTQSQQKHAIQQKPYDLDLPGGEIIPVSMTTFASGAEFTFRTTTDGRYGFIGISAIKTAEEDQLIDGTDGYYASLGITHLPLKEPLVQGKTYHVVYQYQMKTDGSPEADIVGADIERDIVLWPAEQ
ncbi:DUF4179 domain-containing protein [Lapidilactobacillus luobeiensis]|uniref:DUF4179 domain-containing protein n=1 Tax=Lapidilactobacillus luobeiensis TaxID=2950371 RepID=UPI0021C31F1A|nr:DUF4179 domain-containing protein [Lapidilactobacillus luobeiensis]